MKKRIKYLAFVLLVSCSNEKNREVESQNQEDVDYIEVEQGWVELYIDTVENGVRKQTLLDFYTNDTVHKIITGKAGNLIKDEGSYFTIRSGINEREEMLLQIYSIDYPNKEKNLALFGYLINGGEVHLGQWYIDSTYYEMIYSIPDSLGKKITELELCLVYYNPVTMSQDILKCQNLELEW